MQVLAVPPGYASAFWPAAGIAFMALLIRGARVWSGVLLGFFLVNLHIAARAAGPGPIPAVMFPVALGIAAGACLQALVAARLVRRFVGWPTALLNPGQTLRFLGLAGLGACLVSPVVGVSLLRAAHAIPAGAVLLNGFSWYAGDALGVLIVAPLVLAWMGQPDRLWRRVSGPGCAPVRGP